MTHIEQGVPRPDVIDLHTSAAMLISVFGQPEQAGAEVSSYQWRLVHADGSQARIFCLHSADVTAASLQSWRVEADSPAAIEQVLKAMQAGENYYEGTLHPELFIRRGH